MWTHKKSKIIFNEQIIIKRSGDADDISTPAFQRGVKTFKISLRYWIFTLVKKLFIFFVFNRCTFPLSISSSFSSDDMLVWVICFDGVECFIAKVELFLIRAFFLYFIGLPSLYSSSVSIYD